MPKKTIQFDENTSDEKWTAFKESVLNGLRELKAEKIVAEGNTIRFKGAFYTARNFMVHISSGKLSFDDRKKMFSYQLSHYLKMVPGFLFVFFSIMSIFFVPVLRNGFFYFFCVGSLMVMLFGAWWPKNRFDEFVDKCVLKNGIVRKSL